MNPTPLIATVLLMACGDQAAACAILPLDKPLQGQTIADASPTIAWPATDVASRYRVQIHSNAPESGVLATLDVLTTDLSFTPPLPLTSAQASVRVLVSIDCPHFGQLELLERPAHFFIDTTLTCAPPDALFIRNSERDSVVSWTAIAGNGRYEVRRLRPRSDPPIDTHVTNETSISLPLIESGELVQVRALCGSARSEWRSSSHVSMHRQLP